jgi:DeoR family transcriptional regulator of aga operon
MVLSFKEERQHRILEAVHQDQRVTVADLSRVLDVSDVTIRRDLHELAAQGLLRRAHGGAVLATPAPPQPPIVRRMTQVESCKACIGRAAASLIADGESVFIGSGSTAAYVARNLAGRKNLTVVTNALNVATDLATATGVTVVVTGGLMRASELSLVGHIAEQALREVRVDKAIIGMRAISVEAGMTNDYLPEVMTDRAIIEMSPTLIIVADHTKFGRVASAFVAPVDRITTLVTDGDTGQEVLAPFAQLGIEIMVAPAEGQEQG